MLAEWFEVVGAWWERPFLSLGIAMTCFFSGRNTPFLVSVPFLTFVSVANVARHHSSEQGVLDGALATAVALILTAATGCVGWRWWKRNASASTFLMFAAWVQVFLSACKGNAKMLMEQGLRGYFSGGFLACEVGYVLLCLFMMWAAARLTKSVA
jgi:hypothetical protein